MARLFSVSSAHDSWRPRGHELAREPDELVVLPQLAHRAQVEELRLGAPRRLARPRLERLARRREALEVEVAFREPQRDELRVVAVGDRLQRLERRARLRVPARAEQAFGAAELQLEPRAPALERLPQLERVELRLRECRLVAERKLVVDPRPR